VKGAIWSWLFARAGRLRSREGRQLEDAFVFPLVDWAAEAVASHAARLGWTVAVEDTASLRGPLDGLLRSLIVRLLVLHLHSDYRLGHLDSGQPLLDFARRLDSPEHRIRILTAHPGLSRILLSRTIQWVRHGRELFDRLSRDAPDLIVQGFLPNSRIVKRLCLDLGDPHCRARRVSMLRLEGGQDVYYRPRQSSGERILREFSALTEKRPDLLPLFLPRCWVTSDCEWVENVPRASCDTEAGVQRFFRRVGQLGAVFYALGSIDMHADNLIVCGEYPVPIDLETLLSPRFLNEAWWCDTVLKSSFLPVGNGLQRDRSALGSTEPQLSGMRFSYEIEDDGLLREKATRVERVVNRCHPTLMGNTVEPHRYVSDVLFGFRAMYRAIKEERVALQQRVRQVATLRMRVLLRPTRFYIQLLTNLSHPRIVSQSREQRLAYLSGILAGPVGSEFSSGWGIELNDRTTPFCRAMSPCFVSLPGLRTYWTVKPASWTEHWCGLVLWSISKSDLPH
jgi:lantibiotic modifying enzyme